MLPNDWTGNLVGLMHTHRITQQELAAYMGLTNRYVSMVMNGHRAPKGAEQRFTDAVRNLAREKLRIYLDEEGGGDGRYHDGNQRQNMRPSLRQQTEPEE